ncbi:MAG: dihydrolipoamide acetyltransferase family protein [Pseudomonadota bacterium]
MSQNKTKAAEICVPKLGLTMTEGTIVEWLKKPGDKVVAGDVLYVLETDKIENEIEADRDGTLGDIVIAAGETVDVGMVIAQWTDGDPASTAHPATSSPRPEPQAELPLTVSSDTNDKPMNGSRVIASPHARKLARARSIDLTMLTGSGPGGRIVAADVETAVSIPKTEKPKLKGRPAMARPVGAQSAPRMPPSTAKLPAKQRTIAKRMQVSKQEIPHFYVAADADISLLLDNHERLKHLNGYAGLTLNHWVIAAAGMALEANSAWRRTLSGEAITAHPQADVAVAVALPGSLIAPVLRNAGAMTLLEISAASRALADAARNSSLNNEQVGGGVMCVSNLGAYPIRYLTPIIIPGHSCILGVGRTQEIFRPDSDGQPKLCRELGVVLACDHRVLNGQDGAELICAIKELLEDPLRILAEPRRS